MSDRNIKASPSVFISYSHQDRETVFPLASHLGRMGFQVWMDTKDLELGTNIVEVVSKAIERCDLYIVILSSAAISSKWVTHELNTALSLEITRGRPRVLPIMLSKVEVPIAIQSRLYLDISGMGLEEARHRVDLALKEHLPSLPKHDVREIPQERIELSSVILELKGETHKSYGGPHGEDSSKEDVEEEAANLVKSLRRRAQGVLLNFVAASEMDFSSPHPRFPNGEVTSTFKDTAGNFTGTIAKVAVVSVQVLNPDEKKLEELVSSKLSSLGVVRATYSFLIIPPLENLAQRALEKLQKNYVILGWDRDEGAEVELPDDLKLCIFCSDEVVRVGIETKYGFQFEKRAKEFSVREFVRWVTG
jgi:hypothetical protein